MKSFVSKEPLEVVYAEKAKLAELEGAVERDDSADGAVESFVKK